jgi:hypothetical protein
MNVLILASAAALTALMAYLMVVGGPILLGVRPRDPQPSLMSADGELRI